MAHARTRKPSVLIIGTGFGGIGMAIKLKQAGFTDLTLLEKAGGVGGTWRDNTYPGAACDVQSHLYSYSFEPKHDWSRKFGAQPEILEYMESCVHKYQLEPHIQFNQVVTSATFDDHGNQWHVLTETGDTFSADVLITATGQLNRPAMPNIPGLETFRGTCFHSAQWQHHTELHNKRVAVIGTGASAIQFVPEITPLVGQLDLYQRSAAWVLPKPDRPFHQFEQTLFKKLPLWDRLYRGLIYWKNESRALAFTRFSWILDLFAHQARKEARRWVTDPDKLHHLIPDYRIGCKRILISNDWYRAVNQPHVNLLTDGIARIDETGIVPETGEHRPADIIIFGTGFRASEFLSPIHIAGREGLALNDAWSNGSKAFKGISVSGFPNLFMLYGPNTNLAHNSILFMLESQYRYVLSALDALSRYPGAAMDVREDRQSRYCQVVQRGLEGSVWDAGCSSWYLDEHGRNTVNWPGFTFSYRFATRSVDTADYQFLDPVNA
ncbi:4-hydroxyacetophenone monooxygenase [Marinobacter sp. EN3]|jgi:cation diffusion facilitator CzcD-associated flavoprotein CzcO|uniref:flavin-containing monooxygenase n=1 Tax=Marinobacter sp. EN3 TaxID=1397533 RepID=UPI0003B91472|nr:NAD(P)/FAD-dependent oxidoreductase [Marinobacter sp. EN3]ERS12056.1 4-hydroxyacetophenone monooxygenase [Marinobacter sp. EN3]